ncbi:hypothetical protein [Herbaspirillum lusitanum]|uniref:hypothetical protein n=1 Tax=Herbaspirillum lusitanum TaxID=213312 RepID=UPI000367379E|nr:hypothetical protein [Herbaspirillum lusitanum]
MKISRPEQFRLVSIIVEKAGLALEYDDFIEVGATLFEYIPGEGINKSKLGLLNKLRSVYREWQQEIQKRSLLAG